MLQGEVFDAAVSAAAPSLEPTDALQRLAAAGAARREALGLDPSEPGYRPPTSEVRSTAGDALGAMRGNFVRPGLLAKLVVVWFYLLAGLSVGFVGLVTWITGNPMLAPPLFIALAVLVGGAVAHRRNGPRRWLAKRPFRVDGYLELVGREARVTRLLARVEFAGAAPAARFVGDVITGAEVAILAVERAGPSSLAVRSPDVNGDRAALHGWFQALVDRALIPLDAAASIRFIEVEER